MLSGCRLRSAKSALTNSLRRREGAADAAIIPSSDAPGNAFSLADGMVHQTLLAGILAPRRQQFHSAVVAAIVSLYLHFVEERAGEIGDHLLKAGSLADG
jgi:hypothetical protein